MEIQGQLIGILCMDTSNELFKKYGTEVKSYIAASYVKFLEQAGAEVIPIWIARDEQYYRDIMSKINGILLPGGAVFFNSADIEKPEQTNHCVRSSGIIYQIACEMNDNGTYFPLWGTCLGYELLLYHSAGGREIRQDCCKLNMSLPLELENDFKDSKMFKDLPEDLADLLKTEAFAFHFHRYCITKDDLCLFDIADQWKVTGLNQDQNGLKFISTTEHKKYPFYGVQFHPEKVEFELGTDFAISHTAKSIECARYFASFFIAECRKNNNHITDEKDIKRHLICNFRKNTAVKQCYLFN